MKCSSVIFCAGAGGTGAGGTGAGGTGAPMEGARASSGDEGAFESGLIEVALGSALEGALEVLTSNFCANDIKAFSASA
jgi:hypothetical protein